MNNVLSQMVVTARQDVRLFLAPLVGAVQAVKAELNRGNTVKTVYGPTKRIIRAKRTTVEKRTAESRK